MMGQFLKFLLNKIVIEMYMIFNKGNIHLEKYSLILSKLKINIIKP